MTVSPIARRIKHVQRYVHILEVLARYGFATLADQLGLYALLEKGRAAVGAAPPHDHEHLSTPQRLRLAMEELGPTFVKLGQVLSTRPDLVPEEWTEEFKKLQNKVPGVDFAVIQETLEREFPGAVDDIFQSIETTPLAAGSVAQVHRARLHDGTRVVIKVLRPNIRELTSLDMEILHSVAERVEAHFANLGYSPTDVVNELAKELKRELDMMIEARSTERFDVLFEDDPGVDFPDVYWDATTPDVLTMEEVRGTVLADEAAKRIPEENRRCLVENGARAVFMQCLEHGFFHADPHPGNLIALPKGRIAFIDCGMTGQVDQRSARQLADLVTGVVEGNLDQVMNAAGAIADVSTERLEDRTLRSDVFAIISDFRGTSLGRLSLGRVLQDFFSTLRRHKIVCPADIMLLIKALTTIESVGRDLDPSFDMAAFVRPYLEDLLRRRYSPPALVNRFKRGMLQYLELAEDLPAEVRQVFSSLRRNKLAVNLEHRGLDRLTDTVEHASRNISFALIIASLFVGSSILVLAAREAGWAAFNTVGIVGLAVAGVLVVVMVISNRKILR